MLTALRRVGIAIGSLIWAVLIVGLVGGVILSVVDPGHAPFGATASAPEATIATIVTVVLGGLLYREIIRRETPAS